MKIIFILALFFGSFGIHAQNIHYFGSIKAAKTTIDDNDIAFDGIQNKVTVTPLTTAGFSFDATFSDKYQALMQFIYNNSSNMSIDLLQLRYHLSPDVVLRVGRQRLPLNLHSENIQVQALLPWIAPPREVYGRTPIYSFTGASLEKNFGGKSSIHLYAGDTKDDYVSEDAEYKTQTNNLFGARFNFKLNRIDAFFNLFQTDGKLSVNSDVDLGDVGIPGYPTGTGVNAGFSKDYNLEKVQGLNGGFHYRSTAFFFMTEYSLVMSKNSALERAEGFYASLGKEFSEKWITVATFSTDLDVSSELSPTETSSYALNLNYRVDYNNIVKVGFEHINYKGYGTSTYFTGGQPQQNFNVYSLMWAFVY